MDYTTIDKLIAEVADLKRQLGNVVRPATVHEVKGDKMRMVIGRDKDGKEVIGPWLHTSNSMFGGAKERRFFKKGQTLTVICGNGDLSQALVLPGGPNKKFEAPEHANETGQDEETYQQGNLRGTRKDAGEAVFLMKPKEKKQDQQQDQDDHKNEQPKKRERQKPKADALYQLTKDGGFTARIGTSVRVASHSKGAKLKAGSTFITATSNQAIMKSAGDLYCDPNGTPFVPKPWEIGSAPADPVPDDNKIVDEDESEESQGSQQQPAPQGGKGSFRTSV